ncbi:potassium channel family protein [Anabaena sp. CCY 9402-a]|uniref:potassium channel family protein n=1 Tax=Anabaena sp. CCY 9402-a TaxID=3103867 RepID=UPI0039C7396C
MNEPNFSRKQDLEAQRSEILQQLEEWLEIPMLILAFTWLALFIIELIWGLNPLLDVIGITIWIIFILDFAVKLVFASRKLSYIKSNWLTAISLMIPALRTFRIVTVVRSLASVRAIRGLQLLRVMTRTNRGMRALGATVQRRGFGYVLSLTAIVTLVGAAGMYTFESDLPNESGLNNYANALWWTAMLITTMGSEYWPKTPEGRLLCFFLAVYAFAVFGYVTATLATFFIGQDADDDEAELAGAKSITALQAEIAALRADIQALLQQNSNPEKDCRD